ncbi:MAG: dicarboxylate/amino acid:cation symporter [Candidatus Omnitrophica bacterium]|nr:dicarboxylate/amino acid:cation symporter [Candidatus Omnitrophota bacterium]
MAVSLRSFVRGNRYLIVLVGSMIAGMFLGSVLGAKAVLLKPFGDIFLNTLFTIVVPLVFFSVSSAVAGMSDMRRLGRILFWMLTLFAVTGVISALIMIAGVKFYPPAEGVNIALSKGFTAETVNVPARMVEAFSAGDFVGILSKKNMLALIVFALLTGLAAMGAGEKGKLFRNLLVSASAVMSKLISYVMLYAPVGLGAYFAYLVGVFGPSMMGSYLRVVTLYYPLALAYFFFGFSFYAYLAGGVEGIKKFWSNIIPTALTALATSSSLAAVPANLEAAQRIGVPEDVREVVIPIGATIHMDGSCLAAILKISLLFGIFHMEFSGFGTLVTAAGVALLCGVVMSGIPGGGFIGELLIVTLYGFPIEALPIISMVGTLVDPPATMVNSVGDNVISMVVARIVK